MITLEKCRGIYKSELLCACFSSECSFLCPRYFYQRYSIFSKYDEGIWMTDDAWFGVTPEPVAECVLLNLQVVP